MRIYVTKEEIAALDMEEVVEALEYVEADLERAEGMELDAPSQYKFDACIVEVI